MTSTSFMRHMALLLIILGLLLWISGLVLAVMREPSWRLGIGYGGLLIFIGCCLWHVARWKGGAR